jgi:uncharacterized protein YraI
MRRLVLLVCALLLLSLSFVSAQTGVILLVTSEFANVRIFPALGAEVIGSVAAGYIAPATGRSGDSQWFRIDFNGEEGWLNLSTLIVREGDPNSLPIADPRSIPFGGFESPRSGQSSQIGVVAARTSDWLRIRSGPGLGYVILANAPINSSVWVMGRSANSVWLQVNYEGTLGWASSQYLEIVGGADLGVLPIGGIVADRAPISDRTEDDYFATLRLLRDRLNIMNPTVDTLRALWTEASVTGRANCASPYPPRPSDYNVPPPLLASFYPTLNPVVTDFNDIMANTREVLDGFILVCNQPGTGNPVSQAAVQQALDIITLIDSQIRELRRRLTDLIPPDLNITLQPNECLFTFRGRSEVLRVLALNTVFLDAFSPENRSVGYCFDAVQGQVLMFQSLQLADSNIVHFIAVSPFDNPTNFIAVGRSQSGTRLLAVSPVLIPATGRYLFLLSHVGEEPPDGVFAVAISDITGLIYRPDLVVNNGQVGFQQPTPTVAVGTPGTPGGGSGCPNITFTCQQLANCAEAQACLVAGNGSLDPDNNGNPCPNLCGGT